VKKTSTNFEMSSKKNANTTQLTKTTLREGNSMVQEKSSSPEQTAKK
jgi:hypothetical protein